MSKASEVSMHAQPFVTRLRSERGVALITTLLIMMLMSALMIGFTTAVTSDQRYRVIDRDRVKAFYAAQSGIEQLSVGLANLFFANVAPSAAQIAGLGDSVPEIADITFVDDSDDWYGVQTTGDPDSGPISTGPYQGLIALKQEYELNATARTVGGGEAHLKRRFETVAIPVFQFGMFSDVDLSFHAGPNFEFGGRIHSNANLFLAQNNGATLTLPEKVTAVGEIVRQRLVNGVHISDSGHEGTVRMARAPNSYRNLTDTEGSVTSGPTSSLNASWPTISLSQYNGYIRNGKTGARPLNLPLITSGGANTDLVRRPVANEDTSNPTLFAERFYSLVSLRILLSDTAADITSLPGVTGTAPVSLEGANWVTTPPAGYTVDATHPPIARSPGPLASVMTIRNNVAVGTSVAVRLNANVPASFRHPANLEVKTAGGVKLGDLTCTGKGADRFTGCSGMGSIDAGQMITGAVATVDGTITVSTPVTANWTSGNLFVSSTMDFAPNTFWVRNTDDNQNVLVTCRGYNTTDSFLDCNVSSQLDANGVVSSAALTPQGTGLVGGFIKIEMQDTNDVWQDVTMEVLNYGIGAPNQPWTSAMTGNMCPDPTPNAIVRIQRLRDNTEPTAGTCSYAGSTRSSDWWPNTLFDPREGLYRDQSPGNTNILLGGVMHFVELDVRNLSLWIQGAGAYAGGSGPNAKSVNGYSVYFSDRRNNRTAANLETGEYGHEDVVNPSSASGATNDLLDTGEDVNASGALDVYGKLPSYNGVANSVIAGSLAPLTQPLARHATTIQMGPAKANRAVLFRRALKLSNGDIGNIVTPGLTIASENPVYVQGNWNFDAASLANPDQPHAATSVIADAVTLLSSAWTDNISFQYPYSPGNRPRATDSYYRLAIIGGKNAPFPRPSAGGPPQDFGTDGGAHNFLRMLEAGGGTVNYRGSIATFYYSRQAVGVYKCCTTVYGAPTRNFAFDTDFLNPALLPPLTPVFRDLNALGFTQETRPGF